MLIRIAVLFLIGLMALALMGKLRLVGKDSDKAIKKGVKCPECGTWRVGPGPCTCGHDG